MRKPTAKSGSSVAKKTRATNGGQATSSAFFGSNLARPPLQARSRKRHAELIQAGRKLLSTRDFDDIPVTAIVAEAGCAVGSFYTRFEDKNAFFGALQQQVLLEVRAESQRWFASQPWEQMTVARSIDHLIAWLTAQFIAHRGVIRAAHKHNHNVPGAWTPMKAIGREWAHLACDIIASRLKHLPRASRERHFNIAMQFYLGAMVNAVINNPGPLKLGDPKLPVALARAFAGYLQLPDGSERK